MVGFDGGGQLGDGGDTNRKTPFMLRDGVRAIAAGSAHSLVLDTAGALWAFGYNDSGQLGSGGNDTLRQPTRVLEDVTAIAAGGYHTLALRTDGSVWVTGSNGSGQIGQGRGTQSIATFQPLTLPETP
jgi:alpha-tubulin suppressor-like RCC1 family protein